MNAHRKITFLSSLSKLFFLLFIIGLSHPVLSQPTMVLSTAFETPISNGSQTGYADQVLAEAFKRLGYKLETVHLPAERSLINANRGLNDGELGRVAGLQKKYPNLIQVPEFVLVTNMVLLTKNKPTFVLAGWHSVVSHSVAVITGWKIMEKNIEKYGDSIEIIKTDSAEQSFIMLENDRVDFIAYTRWSGLGYLKTHNITNVTLLTPPLASPEMYVYLHKKHKKIVPQLADIIKQMKNDGTMQTLYSQILEPYLSKKIK